MSGVDPMDDEIAEADLIQTSFDAGRVFTPGSPLNERDLFSGRVDQINQIINAISQKGYHAVLYGDRGVGKTSLSNVLVDYLSDFGQSIILPRANCDAADDFTSIWKKILKDVVMSQSKPGYGFTASQIETSQSIVDTLSKKASPDDIRRVIGELASKQTMALIFDEFDRLKSSETKILIADTIKALSDYGIDATIILIGVADSVDELIHEHHSVERALVQIHLPRMSDDEVKQIVTRGLKRLSMTITKDALDEIAALSQGLPYITHLLALHCARAALDSHSSDIQLADVQNGVHRSLDQWQQSIVAAYYAAVKSHQPGNIFKQVLAACALARPDELGYFTAASVRTPLRIMTEKSYDIPNFARHLNEFSKPERGPILQRTGETRRVRYRFLSPLMRPYITMRSLTDGVLSREAIVKMDRA